MAIRLKRMVAFIIDWYISFLPGFILFMFSMNQGVENENASPLIMIPCFIGVFGSFTLFVLRDYIFKGQSLGKKIFGLTILDKDTLSTPKNWQLILKNIFLFIYPIDGVILLATGESLGNRITDTVVVYNAQRNDADV
jgi:uncharacterized RDD family membrane protein YckC